MPFAYKILTVGSKVDAIDNKVSHVTGSASPDTFDDEFTFYNGNKWIDIAMNRAGDNTNVDDSMTFSHSVLHTAPIAKGVTVNETPKFGDTFTVPSATIDEAGHVTVLADHTVEIPTPSMTVSEGNVVVNTSMEPTTCAIEVTRVNVGTLALDEYEAFTTEAPADVAATDTINEAFAKLQKQMNEEEAARAKAIEDEATARSDADKAEKEAREQADANEKEAREKAVSDEAKAREDADKAEKEAREQADADEKAAREKAINDEVSARNDAIGSAINTEVTNRNAAIKTAIDAEAAARDSAIDKAIQDLTNGASEGYDTLKELEDLLNQENTTAAVLVNLRTDLSNHQGADNPHKISKETIGLDKVTNETKAEMFASKEFAAAVESILRNFTMSLTVPLYNIVRPNEASIIMELEEQEGTVSIIWYKKQLDSEQFTVAEAVPAEAYEYEATSVETAGVYRCKLIRTYMGHKSEITTDAFELIYNEPEPEPEEPTPEEGEEVV